MLRRWLSVLVWPGSGLPVEGLVSWNRCLWLDSLAFLCWFCCCCCCWVSLSLAVVPLWSPVAVSPSVCCYWASFLREVFVFQGVLRCCLWHVASPRLVCRLFTIVFCFVLTPHRYFILLCSLHGNLFFIFGLFYVSLTLLGCHAIVQEKNTHTVWRRWLAKTLVCKTHAS